MESTANVFVICLIALFAWDKYNKGSEKAILENKDIQDLAKDWGLWKTKGDKALTTLWNGDLCKKDPSLRSDSRLKCWWHTGGSYFLLLQPLKKEVVSIFPEIVVFHNFISKQEVQRIQELSIPNLHAAGVGIGDSSRVNKGVRDAKHAWLYAWKDPLVKAIERRTQEATGLNMLASEALQVGRYGIGGHYKPHFDHDHSGTEDSKEGNRIATILIYMEPVAEGGSTVFTRLNLAIRPKARSAVFWYNLKRSGEGNPLTEHAACPVSWGDKWVINYWVRERADDPKRNITVINKVPL